MPQTDHRIERAAQKRLARKYKTLGYDVQENPGPDRLPDFMRGAAPDIVARSLSDNVVIEIKRHASLKGSNDIVGIAERVAGHPDWRFELVVLEDERDNAVASERDHRKLLEDVHAATDNRLFDMAFVYLVNVLLQTTRDLAEGRNVLKTNKDEKTLLLDLGFKGILPNALVDRCLHALSIRNDLVHAHNGTARPSKKQVYDLLALCEEMRGLL